MKRREKNEKTPHEGEEEEEDRISELPDSILHQILMMMPMKCAMRTSVLSKRWRHLPSSSAYALSLEFDDKLYQSTSTVEEFIDTVDLYLHLHKATDLPVFRLSFRLDDLHLPQFRRWIQIAAEKRVRQLDLDFQIYSPPFKWPPCLSSSDTLTVLKLHNCTFELGIDFKGLSALRILHFRKVVIASNVLDAMLLNCPSLEELSLCGCGGLRSLKVSMVDLRLKRLTLMGCCGFDNAGLIKALSERAQLRSITICDVAVQHLVGFSGTIAFPNLIELQLLNAVCRTAHEIKFSHLDSFLGLFSFPCLEKLVIELRWKRFEQIPLRCAFNNLKKVKINGFDGDEEQMELVKFLRAESFLLETVDLATSKEGSLKSLFPQLLLTPRASPKVQLVLNGHLEDDNGAH